MTYELIETVSLASSAASVTFQSIPQDGLDLLIVLSLRSTSSQTIDETLWSINNITNTFRYRRLLGSGNGVTTFSGTERWTIPVAPNTGMTANTFGNAQFYLPNYTSTEHKTVAAESLYEFNNDSNVYQGILAGVWETTSAINKITIANSSGGNWETNSSASLYKIF